LNGKANQIAKYLARLGAAPGARIGICCERSFELIAGIYGILKAGAAYVPMDPSYPAERLQYMTEAAGVTVVLTQCHLANMLSGFAALSLVVLDGKQSEWSALSCENVDVSVSDDDLIYVIFTSGTTGRPKGAAVYHRGFTNLLNWFVDEFQIDA